MEKEITMRTFWNISKILLVISSVLLVVFLRFYQLGKIPLGINVDEASYGYDAFNLLKTGNDMWGNHDTTLKSFGDYKPAGLAYTLIPFVKYLGLNTFSTRLPSSIFGILTLLITFIILRLLFQNKLISYLGVFILALSPWHFGLSRLFYEPNVGLFFIVCSIYFQIRYLRNPESIKYLVITGIFVALGGYYYAVLRYLGVGMLGITLIIANLPNYQKIIKHGAILVICWVVIALPYLGDMFGSKGLVRLGQEGALHEFGNVLVITENREMCYISSGYSTAIAKSCYILWNKPGEKIVNAARTYVELFSPKYLFLTGYQKDIVPEKVGAFIAILYPVFLLGIYFCISKFGKQKEVTYLLSSLLFVNMPIAIAGAQNIHRNVIGLYFAFLIIIYGLNNFVQYLSKIDNKLLKLAIVIFSLMVFLWSQSRYLVNYFYIYTRIQPDIWLSDTPEVMEWLGTNRKSRNIVYYDYDAGPLYYSFYNHLDPSYFQKSVSWDDLNQYGWTRINRVGDLLRNGNNVWNEICSHHGQTSDPKLLVMGGRKSEWHETVQKQTKNFTGIHVLHEIYDSKILHDYIYQKDPKGLELQCSALEKK